jgi:hypothetical protein
MRIATISVWCRSERLEGGVSLTRQVARRALAGGLIEPVPGAFRLLVDYSA